jgi:hypothetical protein
VYKVYGTHDLKFKIIIIMIIIIIIIIIINSINTLSWQTKSEEYGTRRRSR